MDEGTRLKRFLIIGGLVTLVGVLVLCAIGVAFGVRRFRAFRAEDGWRDRRAIEVALINYEAGIEHFEAGEYLLAEGELQAYVASVEPLLDEFRSSASLYLELAKSYEYLGRCGEELESWEDSEKHWERARDLYAAALIRGSTLPEALSGPSLADCGIGRVRWHRNDVAGARDRLMRGYLRLRQHKDRRTPDGFDTMAHFGTACSWLAFLHAEEGRENLAERFCQEAIEAHRGVILRTPDDVYYVLALTDSLYRLAMLRLEKERSQEGLDLAQEALALLDGLSMADAGRLDVVQLRADVAHIVALFQQELGQEAAALDVRLVALSRLLPVRAAHPDDWDLWYEDARLTRHVVKSLCGADRAAEGLEHAVRFVADSRKCGQHEEADGWDNLRLAYALTEHARACTSLGQPAVAAKSLEEALVQYDAALQDAIVDDEDVPLDRAAAAKQLSDLRTPAGPR